MADTGEEKANPDAPVTERPAARPDRGRSAVDNPILAAAGSLSGLWRPGELDELRDEWD